MKIVPVLAGLAALVLAGAAFLRRSRGERGPAVPEQAYAADTGRQRAPAAGTGRSPLPAVSDDPLPGDLGLLDPVRSPFDAAFADLSRRYAGSDPAGRARMRRSLPTEEYGELHVFGKRAAVFAIRERGAGHLRDGLAALAMAEGERIEPRDFNWTLGLLYHAAGRIGEDADRLLRDAAALAEPGTARLFHEYAARPPELKDLRRVAGYVETESGTGLVEWGHAPRYDPTCDLTRIVLGLAKLLAADRYQPPQVTIASVFPRTWLEPARDRSLGQTLQAVRAGGRVVSFLRPDVHPEEDNLHFLDLFLVELEDEAAARALLETSRRASTRKVPILGIAEGRLVCLVIASSLAPDRETYETPESLARLVPRIAAILREHAALHP